MSCTKQQYARVCVSLRGQCYFFFFMEWMLNDWFIFMEGQFSDISGTDADSLTVQ